MLKFCWRLSIVLCACLAANSLYYVNAQMKQLPGNAFVTENFTKEEYMIPMRDGVRLFTSVYIPKDKSIQFPILMERTPYSCSPYGITNMPAQLGPNSLLMYEKYIFVYQDVRGRYKSEGNFEEMTPAIDDKKSAKETDESSDTYDTIDWLLKNIAGNNGRVGMYGISYPGFYASAALPDAHPALKAVSPQAPVTDEFIGDDANHNGAFFLLDNFDFTNYFQGTRIDSGRNYSSAFEAQYKDAFVFFKGLEPISSTNSSRYFNNKAKIWNEYLQHTTYDSYWKARNIRPHLKNVTPAVLVTGGWFDAEDMFGALRTYEAVAHQNPKSACYIVMGPWTHGAWSRKDWSHFGPYSFGENINSFYQSEIETKFFNFYLKDKGSFHPSAATVFETGSNQWKHYDSWPPTTAKASLYYLAANGKLQPDINTNSKDPDSYVSDPNNPVPYTPGVHEGRNNEYMVEDQRFTAIRPDVVTYSTGPLQRDVTITGRLRADIFISSTGTDADLIVKIIDLTPDSANKDEFRNLKFPGYERLVRAEVFRCKFRNSFEKPEALVPGQVSEIKFDINETAHTFRKGHRIMVQIQSSWFPLVDLNPQKFVDIPTCSKSDFQKQTISVYHDNEHRSSVMLPVLQ